MAQEVLVGKELLMVRVTILDHALVKQGVFDALFVAINKDSNRNHTLTSLFVFNLLNKIEENAACFKTFYRLRKVKRRPRRSLVDCKIAERFVAENLQKGQNVVVLTY